MKLKLYLSAEEQPVDGLENLGLTEAVKYLKRKRLPCVIVDTSKLSEEDIFKAYAEAIRVSVIKKCKIRQIFGSKRRSGWLFGKAVPALLVYADGNSHPIDVYPHEEHGRIVTIKEFLDKLLSAKRKQFRRFVGIIESKEALVMSHAIEAACERIDTGGW